MQCDNIHPSPRDLFPSHSHQSTSFSGPFPTLISSSPSVCQSVPPPFSASLPPMLCLLSLPLLFRPRAGNHSCYVFMIASVISCPEDGAPTTLLPPHSSHHTPPTTLLPDLVSTVLDSLSCIVSWTWEGVTQMSLLELSTQSITYSQYIGQLWVPRASLVMPESCASLRA